VKVDGGGMENIILFPVICVRYSTSPYALVETVSYVPQLN